MEEIQKAVFRERGQFTFFIKVTKLYLIIYYDVRFYKKVVI